MTREPARLDSALLRSWPLPALRENGDKEDRGRVLVIAGSREMPGAAVLCANAALRAGAGKVAIGVCESIATAVGIAVPESRVIALPETLSGGIAAAAAGRLAALLPKIDALLIGPGMIDIPAVCELVEQLVPQLPHAAVILDAAAMDVVIAGNCLPRFTRPVVMTPHCGEMAHLTGIRKTHARDDAIAVARDAASQWNAVVALKGAITFIATPDGHAWRHEGGSVGLGVSGSGDVLAGVICGLAARGASLEQACAWAVALHARAGARLEARMGTLGFFAREIAAEVPALMDEASRFA